MKGDLIGGSFTLVRVRGVPVRIHWSLLVFLPYLAAMFAIDFAHMGAVAGLQASEVAAPRLVWGVVLALALFTSVALHELAHTLVAIRAGGRVRSITLMVLGGVSHVERMPPSRAREALMAAAGPAASLMLGLVFLALLPLVPSGAPDLTLGLFYVGQMNVVLGIFNLLPAFPMDGGRLLRALLATRIGVLRATRIAATTGKVVAVLMGVVGIWSGNILLALIGVFVYAGAGAEARGEETRSALGSLRVADLMVPDPPAIEIDAPVADVFARMRAAGRLELVVVDRAHHPVGLVRAADLHDLTADQRMRWEVSDLGGRLSATSILATPEEPLISALERAGEAAVDHVIAVDHADPPHLVGLLDRRDLDRAVLLHDLDHRHAA